MACMKNRRFVYVVIAVLITFALLATTRKWQFLERRAYDLRFQTVEHFGIGKSKPTGNVVIVGIEEKAVIKEKPLIFWYPDIGRFLSKMKDYDAKVIGIDLIPLHELSEKVKKAVYAVYDSNLDRKYEAFLDEAGERLNNSLLKSIITVSDSTPIVQAYGGGLVPYYYKEMAFMRKIYPGNTVFTDTDTETSDGVIREQALKLDDKSTFAYSMYNLLTGSSADQGPLRLNYSLWKNIPFYCFSDVLNDRIDSRQFSQKAVILGFISRSEDLHITPVNQVTLPACFSEKADVRLKLGNRMPGPLIHAVIEETLLTRTALNYVPFAAGSFVLVVLVVTSLIVSVRLRPVPAVAVLFLIGCTFFAVDLKLFSQGTVIPVFPHILSPLIVLTLVYPYRYIVEERSRKKIYKTFSYYIDREVIDSLLQKDPQSILKGDYSDVCILFLDIRDFTKLSMQQKAENIVAFLNVFFGRITEIIQGHKGFVNKFIGDGVLAFFGTGENPVANAVRAAQEIVRETERFNREGIVRPFLGAWDLNVGIGIHYGRVIMGNIGSEKKMDFTIIGDHVNIASRIEGLTKQIGRRLLLSDAAYQMVKEGFIFEHLGEFSVKGVEKPLSIYMVSDQGDE
jgi:adenylate cyclase